MKAFIIDPFEKTIIETTLPDAKKAQMERVEQIIGSEEYHITFIYPTEFRTCTAYMGIVRKTDPFFRVRGFVDKVKFGKTVVLDKTATGYPKSDNVTLYELKEMITFFP